MLVVTYLLQLTNNHIAVTAITNPVDFNNSYAFLSLEWLFDKLIAKIPANVFCDIAKAWRMG